MIEIDVCERHKRPNHVVCVGLVWYLRVDEELAGEGGRAGRMSWLSCSLSLSLSLVQFSLVRHAHNKVPF